MNDREHNIIEIVRKQKLGVLQPSVSACCLHVLEARRNCRICTELSVILGVTYYHEKLARRK